jgi:DNA-binding beta-propeller fold protein YncE
VYRKLRFGCIGDPRERFFVNIADPARIIAIDARSPTRISREYDVSAAGPHGLDLDPATGRLMCACDAGVLLAIDPESGNVVGDVTLSGAPDVIFLDHALGRLYVAVGDPGVIDVIDVKTMRREEVVATEAGAHTLALDRKRSKVYVFLPRSHRAACFTTAFDGTAFETNQSADARYHAAWKAHTGSPRQQTLAQPAA